MTPEALHIWSVEYELAHPGQREAMVALRARLAPGIVPFTGRLTARPPDESLRAQWAAMNRQDPYL